MQIIYKENIPEKNEIFSFLEDFDDLAYHQQIVEKAVHFSKKITNIEAIFIMGSLALDSADIFSDIDFYVMISQNSDIDAVKEMFLSNLIKFGDIIHIFQSNAYSKNSIVYFKPYIKFDLVIEDFDKMCKNWRVGKRGKLLFDRNGLGKEAMNVANNISFNISKHKIEIKNVAIELPSFCYNIAGYMIRGEFVTSIDFVAWIRRLLMRISGFLLGIWDEGTRRAETRFPSEIISYYHQCQITEINDVWKCLETFLEWFSEWLVPQFDKYNISHAYDEIPLMKMMISRIKESYKRKKTI